MSNIPTGYRAFTIEEINKLIGQAIVFRNEMFVLNGYDKETRRVLLVSASGVKRYVHHQYFMHECRFGLNGNMCGERIAPTKLTVIPTNEEIIWWFVNEEIINVHSGEVCRIIKSSDLENVMIMGEKARMRLVHYSTLVGNFVRKLNGLPLTISKSQKLKPEKEEEIVFMNIEREGEHYVMRIFI